MVNVCCHFTIVPIIWEYVELIFGIVYRDDNISAGEYVDKLIFTYQNNYCFPFIDLYFFRNFDLFSTVV